MADQRQAYARLLVGGTRRLSVDGSCRAGSLRRTGGPGRTRLLLHRVPGDEPGCLLHHQPGGRARGFRVGRRLQGPGFPLADSGRMPGRLPDLPAGDSPTGGFVGKLWLLRAVVDADMVWLAVVAGLNTAISAYYYFKLVKTMYLERDEGVALRPFAPGFANLSILVGFAVVTLALGLAFGGVAELARNFSL